MYNPTYDPLSRIVGTNIKYVKNNNIMMFLIYPTTTNMTRGSILSSISSKQGINGYPYFLTFLKL